MNNYQPLFRIKKPAHWDSLLLYEKVSIYKSQLGLFHSQFVDKINVKQIVTNMCNGEIKVAPIIRILKNVNDLQKSDIHSNYLIKASHASKWNINIKKNKVYNILQLKNQLKKWNIQYNPIQEKQYSYLSPQFFIEEKINDKYVGNNGNAIVYMCRIFDGVCKSISVKHHELRNDYDIHWNLIPYGDNQIKSIHIEKPKKLELMIHYAEKMGSLFEFVRMDFYIDINDDIYFSEFTFTPMNGEKVLSHQLEKELSQYWVV